MATKYYVLIKKKGTKKWLGAIPSRNGVSITKLRSSLKNASKKFVYKIINSKQLKRLIISLKPKGRKTRAKRTVSKRRVRRKSSKRRKVRKPMRRRVKRRIKRPKQRVRRIKRRKVRRVRRKPMRRRRRK